MKDISTNNACNVLGKTQAMTCIIKLIDDGVVDDLNDLRNTIETLITKLQ